MIKVLHIVPGFLYGGIESRLLDWYKCMDRDTIQFDIIKVTPDEPNSLIDEFRNLGGNVYSIPPIGLKTTLSHFSSVKEIINSGSYNVIHSHGLTYGYYPLLIGKKKGITKRILHSRTIKSNPGECNKNIKIFLGKMALKYATDFFACSEEAGIAAFGSKKNVEIIKNGIFVDEFAFNDQYRIDKRRELGLRSSFVLGYVGRFSTPKNIPFLFDIFIKVHRIIPDTKLLVVGDQNSDKELYNNVTNICEKNNVLNDVIFAGRQRDIPKWLNAMDVFLAPSLFEGFGTVAIEAQANGLPCFLSVGFPQSTKVSENVMYLPIDDSELWTNEIIKFHNSERKGGDIDKIKDMGYDVHVTAQKLFRYYCS